MKFIFSLLLLPAQNALASGSWILPSAGETVTVTPSPGILAPLPPRRPAPATPAERTPASSQPPAPTSAVPDGCTNNFAKASALFKSVHGNDVDISRIGEFAGNFKSYNSTNALRNSGGTLILNLKIRAPFVGLINADVPVTVCKTNGRLTAQLLTSNTREAGTQQPQRLITGMVQSGDAPGSITLSITRSGGQIGFSGRSGETQVSASAAVR